MTKSKDSAVQHATERVIRFIALAIATIGASALFGWFFSIGFLLRWGGSINMRFNTALCLVAASMGLWFARSASLSARSKMVVRCCGGFASAVTLMTLAQYGFGWDLHIDQLLWKDTLSASNPGRMALLTAIVLFCAGVFFVCLRSRRTAVVWLAQFLAVGAGLGAQWSVIDVLLRRSEGTSVAPNTALALLLLCVGIAFTPAEAGFLQPIARDTAGGRLLRRLLPAILIAPIALAWLRWHLSEWGVFDIQTGMVLLITACTAALVVIAVWTANTSDQVEAERERLEQELTGFFNLPLDSMLSIIGFDGRFVRVSSSWTRILGYGEEEILNTPYIEFVHPEDRQRTAGIATDIAAGQAVTGFENRYRTSDGSYRWFTWNAIPATGDVMYAIAEDITERKQIEAELRDNSERLQLLIEGARDHALYMLDSRGKIASWNAGAARLTGYSAAEAIGQPVSMLYSPEVPDGTMEEELTAALRHGSAQMSGWRLRKDGTRFISEGYITALYDSEGSLRGFAKIVHDVTERMAAEQRIRQLNEELEERVKQRTAELAASNRELEAFAYSVSHDLRAPLRHLDGFLALLRRRAYAQLDESARHYVDATMEASRRMGTLIDELLQFSRLGRTSLHRAEVNLNEVIAEVRRDLQADVAKRSVRWDVATLPNVAGDRTLLRQVMQNLLANALKFTRTRTEAVIRIGAETAGNGEITITVADNGVGFDMQYYNKLFGVFQRLHTEDEFEGTGIGLANVRRIVERHGGRVWAEGEVDHGASFHFTLPANVIKTPREDNKHNELVETYSAG